MTYKLKPLTEVCAKLIQLGVVLKLLLIEMYDLFSPAHKAGIQTQLSFDVSSPTAFIYELRSISMFLCRGAEGLSISTVDFTTSFVDT